MYWAPRRNREPAKVSPLGRKAGAINLSKRNLPLLKPLGICKTRLSDWSTSTVIQWERAARRETHKAHSPDATLLAEGNRTHKVSASWLG
uniref:Uncharacterized protein n=1 Tax=Aeromonas virus AHPMCC11 TaxID=3035930 RepID=A0AAT9TV70_9VIRU